MQDTLCFWPTLQTVFLPEDNVVVGPIDLPCTGQNWQNEVRVWEMKGRKGRAIGVKSKQGTGTGGRV